MDTLSYFIIFAGICLLFLITWAVVSSFLRELRVARERELNNQRNVAIAALSKNSGASVTIWGTDGSFVNVCEDFDDRSKWIVNLGGYADVLYDYPLKAIEFAENIFRHKGTKIQMYHTLG